MAGIREQQKAEKKRKLLDAAYRCFVEKGLHKTSIDDIVARAGVAKGTFYLYFADKAHLSDQLYISLSKKILLHAYHEVEKQEINDYIPLVLAFVDAIIEYLRSNKSVLALCGSVGYSSIIKGEPDTIDNMKPVLYDIITRALQQ